MISIDKQNPPMIDWTASKNLRNKFWTDSYRVNQSNRTNNSASNQHFWRQKWKSRHFSNNILARELHPHKRYRKSYSSYLENWRTLDRNLMEWNNKSHLASTKATPLCRYENGMRLTHFKWFKDTFRKEEKPFGKTEDMETRTEDLNRLLLRSKYKKIIEL